MATEAIAGNYFRYFLQIGEKPGVPSYALEIEGNRFTVKKSILFLDTQELSAKGTLKDGDLNELKKLIDDVPESASSEEHGVFGSFSLEAHFSEGFKKISGSSRSSLHTLRPIMKWIQALHQKYPGLSAIKPLAPGDLYRPKY